MTKFIFKNQKLIAEKQAQLSINERGFLFGDGVFETCKIFNGQIYNFKSHQKRLKNGLKNLKISADIDNLEQNSLKLIKKNQIESGILKISISRGIGSNGYLPTNKSKPLIIIWAKKSRKTPTNITLGISTQQTPIKNIGKTHNSLPYILTKIEAQKDGFFDNVMLSSEGKIAEVSSANIFWVKNGVIFTPDKSCGILNGTIRQKLLQIEPNIKEIAADIAELKKADEIFITNSSLLIAPVSKFLDKKLTPNLSLKLLKKLQDDIKKSCKK